MRRTGILIALLTLAAACGGSDRPRAESAGAPVSVRTAAVTSVTAADAVEAGGLVAARTTAAISSRVLAPVTSVLVRPGDRVRSGQTLIRLDVSAMQAESLQRDSAAEAAADGVRAATADRASADAARTLAQATYDRVSALQARGSATRQELDEATSALAAATARVEAATARVAEATSGRASADAAGRAARIAAAYGEIAAPFAGVVTEKLIDPGTLAAPGVPLLRLEDTSAFTLDVRVDAGRAEATSVGQRLPVDIDEIGRLDGQVIEMARAVDAGARSVLVRVELPGHEGLRSGLFGRAQLPTRPRVALRVPETAVVRNGQLASVFVVDDGRARLRLVRVGEPADGLTEVLAGLAAGERVVLQPPPGLIDGRAVAAEAR